MAICSKIWVWVPGNLGYFKFLVNLVLNMFKTGFELIPLRFDADIFASRKSFDMGLLGFHNCFVIGLLGFSKIWLLFLKLSGNTVKK